MRKKKSIYKIIVNIIILALVQVLAFSNSAWALEASLQKNRDTLSPQIQTSLPLIQNAYSFLKANKEQGNTLFLRTEASIEKTPSELRKDLLELMEFLGKKDFKILIDIAFKDKVLTQDQYEVLLYCLKQGAVSLEKIDRTFSQQRRVDITTVTRWLVGTSEQGRKEIGAYQIIYEDASPSLREKIDQKLAVYIKENIFDFFLNHMDAEIKNVMEKAIENWQGEEVEKEIIRIKLSNPGVAWKDIYEHENVNLKKGKFYKTLKRIKKNFNKAIDNEGTVIIEKIIIEESPRALKYLAGDLMELKTELLDVIETSERLKVKKMDEEEKSFVLRMSLFEGEKHRAIDKINKFFLGRSQMFLNGRTLEENFYEGAKKIKQFLLLPGGKYLCFFEPKDEMINNSFEKNNLVFAVLNSSSKAKRINLDKYIISGKSLSLGGNFVWNQYKINCSNFQSANIEFRVENDIPRFIKLLQNKEGQQIRDNKGEPLVIEVFDMFGQKVSVRRQLADKYFLKLKLNDKKIRCSYNEAEKNVHEAIVDLKRISIDLDSWQFKKKLREVKKALWVIRGDLKGKEQETARFICDMAGRDDLFEILQNISMKGMFRSYLTFQSAFDAYMARDKDKRHFDSLNCSKAKGGDITLLDAVRNYGILKRKIEAEYKDVHEAHKEFMFMDKKDISYVQLSMRKDDGGNPMLLKAFYKFRQELKDIYGFTLPDNTHKRKSKKEVQAFLDNIPEREQTPKKLKENNLWWVYNGAKYYKIVLPKERDFIDNTGYDSYKERINNRNKYQEVDMFELWHSMETDQEARNQLIEYFMPMIIDTVEDFNGRKGKYITEHSQFYLDGDISRASVAMIEAIDDWHPEMDMMLDGFVKDRIISAFKKSINEFYKDKRIMQSSNTPKGNKDGNYAGKSGPFGNGRINTLDDKFEANTVAADDAFDRVQRMERAVAGIGKGDYSFLVGSEFEINESMLIPKIRKQQFAEELRSYLLKRGVLENISGKFAIWVMGSMGNIGLARKGDSDVNLIVLMQASNGQCKEAVWSLEALIGTGEIFEGNDENFILEIGKNGSRQELDFYAPQFVSLLEKYEVGINGKGAASIEVVSTNAAGYGDNRALKRARFHVVDDITGMGTNGILVLESDEGIAQELKQQVRDRFVDDFEYHIDFANEYLIYFFAEQVEKLKSTIDKNKKVELPLEPNVEIQEEASEESSIFQKADSPRNRGFFQDKVRLEVFNGFVSIRLIDLIEGGVMAFKDEWRHMLTVFEGKNIFVDDYLKTDNVDPGKEEAIEALSDELLIYLQKEIQQMSGHHEKGGQGWTCSSFDFEMLRDNAEVKSAI
ncbi:MAG: hypothetical protein KJ915_09285 [Candidatus Omnitrophica bacterium]|nr:hypothetical protein [Candidatus Omnitrophota bacterium]